MSAKALGVSIMRLACRRRFTPLLFAALLVCSSSVSASSRYIFSIIDHDERDFNDFINNRRQLPKESFSATTCSSITQNSRYGRRQIETDLEGDIADKDDGSEGAVMATRTVTGTLNIQGLEWGKLVSDELPDTEDVTAALIAALSADLQSIVLKGGARGATSSPFLITSLRVDIPNIASEIQSTNKTDKAQDDAPSSSAREESVGKRRRRATVEKSNSQESDVDVTEPPMRSTLNVHFSVYRSDIDVAQVSDALSAQLTDEASRSSWMPRVVQVYSTKIVRTETQSIEVEDEQNTTIQLQNDTNISSSSSVNATVNDDEQAKTASETSSTQSTTADGDLAGGEEDTEINETDNGNSSETVSGANRRQTVVATSPHLVPMHVEPQLFRRFAHNQRQETEETSNGGAIDTPFLESFTVKDGLNPGAQTTMDNMKECLGKIPSGLNKRPCNFFTIGFVAGLLLLIVLCICIFCSVTRTSASLTPRVLFDDKGRPYEEIPTNEDGDDDGEDSEYIPLTATFPDKKEVDGGEGGDKGGKASASSAAVASIFILFNDIKAENEAQDAGKTSPLAKSLNKSLSKSTIAVAWASADEDEMRKMTTATPDDESKEEKEKEEMAMEDFEEEIDDVLPTGPVRFRFKPLTAHKPNQSIDFIDGNPLCPSCRPDYIQPGAIAALNAEKEEAEAMLSNAMTAIQQRLAVNLEQENSARLALVQAQTNYHKERRVRLASEEEDAESAHKLVFLEACLKKARRKLFLAERRSEDADVRDAHTLVPLEKIVRDALERATFAADEMAQRAADAESAADLATAKAQQAYAQATQAMAYLTSVSGSAVAAQGDDFDRVIMAATEQAQHAQTIAAQTRADAVAKSNIAIETHAEWQAARLVAHKAAVRVKRIELRHLAQQTQRKARDTNHKLMETVLAAEEMRAVRSRGKKRVNFTREKQSNTSSTMVTSETYREVTEDNKTNAFTDLLVVYALPLIGTVVEQVDTPLACNPLAGDNDLDAFDNFFDTKVSRSSTAGSTFFGSTRTNSVASNRKHPLSATLVGTYQRKTDHHVDFLTRHTMDIKEIHVQTADSNTSSRSQRSNTGSSERTGSASSKIDMRDFDEHVLATEPERLQRSVENIVHQVLGSDVVRSSSVTSSVLGAAITSNIMSRGSSHASNRTINSAQLPPITIESIKEVNAHELLNGSSQPDDAGDFGDEDARGCENEAVNDNYESEDGVRECDGDADQPFGDDNQDADAHEEGCADAFDGGDEDEGHNGDDEINEEGDDEGQNDENEHHEEAGEDDSGAELNPPSRSQSHASSRHQGSVTSRNSRHESASSVHDANENEEDGAELNPPSRSQSHASSRHQGSVTSRNSRHQSASSVHDTNDNVEDGAEQGHLQSRSHSHASSRHQGSVASRSSRHSGQRSAASVQSSSSRKQIVSEDVKDFILQKNIL